MLVAAGTLGVMLPSILPSAAANVSAFIDNVVRFPLGLAGISSPAASPLIGHVVVQAFPGEHRLFTLGRGRRRSGGVALHHRAPDAPEPGSHRPVTGVDVDGGHPSGSGHSRRIFPLTRSTSSYGPGYCAARTRRNAAKWN